MRKQFAKAYLQGHLDSLCGVYVQINIVHVLHGPINGHEAEQLFQSLMRKRIGKADPISRVHAGTSAREFVALLRYCCAEYELRYFKPFSLRYKWSLDAVWRRMLEFNVQREGVIALSVESERWSHWTLAKRVTSSRLELADSCSLAYLNRHKCTLGRTSRARPYQLDPDNMYFVCLDE